MNVLEKILEEIEERKQEHLCNAELEIEETVNRMEELNWVCALIYYMEEVKKANVQTNDDWIPCSKRLPEVPEGIEDDYCPEFNVTIKGADKATTLKYAPDGTWFDDSGEVYNVIAWKPLPEAYRAADNSKPDWKENMLNTFLTGH